MKKIITLLALSVFITGTFAYTTTNVSQANSLASKKIIKDWGSNPRNYRFDDYIARSEIMGMVLAMMNITRNTTCRGDFADVPKSDTDWVCRTIETAADRGIINAQKEKTKSLRKARPYDHITRAEALGILMKAAKNTFNKTAYCNAYALPDTDFGCGAIELMQSEEGMQSWQFDTFLAYYASVLKKTVPNIVSSDTRFRANSRATRGEVFDFAYNISQTQNIAGTCGEWNNYDFASLSTMNGLDLLALAGANKQFCSSGIMSHLYENNTGIAWSCDGTTNRVCKTDAFSYGNSRLKIDSVSGEDKKGALVTLNISNFPFSSIVQIQAGNYSRHAMIQLVEGFSVSADGKKISFTLPANLNGAMGEFPGESHLPDEPYAIYLTNTSNGEYVKLYNPFGTGATQ